MSQSNWPARRQARNRFRPEGERMTGGMVRGGSEHASLSDLGLMALVQRGDEGALAELYDRHATTAFTLAMRVLRDRRDAEDTVQEAFTTLWSSAARFDPGRASPSTWLLVLTHRRAVDLVRREARRP